MKRNRQSVGWIPKGLRREIISIEFMTPADYAKGGKNLSLRYRYAESPFGLLLLASTDKGLCFMAFDDDGTTAFEALRLLFPNAYYELRDDVYQQRAIAILSGKEEPAPLPLFLKGSAFQANVWKALLEIPVGKVVSYGEIACLLNCPKACRAVGTAVGANPVALFIPCHRVIRSDGSFGGYRWGIRRKAALLRWEAESPLNGDVPEKLF